MNSQAIDITLIDPNPWQTRQQEDSAHVDQLARSILKDGLMQWPVVRPVGERYQLAFGHSRKAAFGLLVSLGHDEFREMPVFIRDWNDEQMAVAAFEENEKRRDLNPVEKAEAVKRMIDGFGWTQQEVAERLHIDRSSVSNMLRMLRMPAEMLALVREGTLPVRSAMALLPWYELNEPERECARNAHPEVDEFFQAARTGGINSDTIRERLAEFMECVLAPQQVRIEDVLVTVESDAVEAVPDEDDGAMTDEEMEFVESRPIDESEFIPAGKADVGAQTSVPLDKTIFPPNHAPVDAEKEAEPEVTVPAEPQAAAVEPTPAAEPADTSLLLTISWNGNGVVVGLRKPGSVPAMRFLTALDIDELPDLLREMGW